MIHAPFDCSFLNDRPPVQEYRLAVFETALDVMTSTAVPSHLLQIHVREIELERENKAKFQITRLRQGFVCLN